MAAITRRYDAMARAYKEGGKGEGGGASGEDGIKGLLALHGALASDGTGRGLPGLEVIRGSG